MCLLNMPHALVMQGTGYNLLKCGIRYTADNSSVLRRCDKYKVDFFLYIGMIPVLFQNNLVLCSFSSA